MSNDPRTLFYPFSVAPLNRLIESIRRRTEPGLLVVSRSALVAAAILGFCGSAASQPKVTLFVTSTAPGQVRIELESPLANDTWSFPNAYAGIVGLGNRVEKISAQTADGRNIPVRKLAPGEFKTLEMAVHLSYEVRIAEPPRLSNKSHISWLNNREGLIMMADLLPSSISQQGSGSIYLKVPEGWTISSNARPVADALYSADLSNSVFLTAAALKDTTKKIDSNNWLLACSGEWPASQTDIAKAVSRIAREYSKLTGFKLRQNPTLLLIPIQGAGPEQWSAETRGNSVVLLMGAQAERRQLLARLAVILTHELFHLWVPNSVALKGDYDWFFEGFTLYQALRMTQKLGLVDFPEYLRTLARVYDSYLLADDRDRLSLIELSERRWTSAKSLVYDRSMLVAFLYDLQLRLTSGGRATSSDIYRELFSMDLSGSTDRLFPDANETIIGILNRPPGMEGFSARYIQPAGSLELQTLLAPYGIEVERDGFKSQFRIAVHLNEAQSKLLRSLGYRR